MNSLDETLRALDELLQVTNFVSTTKVSSPGAFDLPRDTNESLLHENNFSFLTPMMDINDVSLTTTTRSVLQQQNCQSNLTDRPSPVPSHSSMGSEEIRKSLDELDAVIEVFDQECREVREHYQMTTSFSLLSGGHATTDFQHQEYGNNYQQLFPPHSLTINSTNNDFYSNHTEDSGLSTTPIGDHDFSILDSRTLTRNKPPPPKRNPNTRLSSSITQVKNVCTLQSENNEITNEITSEITNAALQENSNIMIEINSENVSNSNDIDTTSRSVSDILKKFQKPSNDEVVNNKKDDSGNKTTGSMVTRSLNQKIAKNENKEIVKNEFEIIDKQVNRPFVNDSFNRSTFDTNSRPEEPTYSVPIITSAQPSSSSSSSTSSRPKQPPPAPPKRTVSARDCEDNHSHKIDIKSNPLMSSELTKQPTYHIPPPPPFPSTFASVNNESPSPPPPPPPHDVVIVYDTVNHFKSALQSKVNVGERKSSFGGQANVSDGHSALLMQLKGGVSLRRTNSLANQPPSQMSTSSTTDPNVILSPRTNTQNETENNCVRSSSNGNSKNGSDTNLLVEGINVQNIDGYVKIPDECPPWKRAIMEKKNNELIAKVLKQREEERKEKEKWIDTPEWKRHLLEVRCKKMEEIKKPQSEHDQKKQEEAEKLDSMPEWKRNLVLKKRTVVDVE